MAQKRQHLSSSSSAAASSQPGDAEPSQIFQSSSIHDRGSIFTAIFSTSTTYLSNPKSLQAHGPFKDAMHKMLAYRRESKQKSLSFQNAQNASTASGSSHAATKAIYVTVSDEDGERYAGKKLEKLLDEMKVEGVVVVARWYGGVLLGPVRFEHIVNVAREAIVKWRSGTNTISDDDERNAKRAKIDSGTSAAQSGLNVVDEAKERARLARVLNDRDTSVLVLRSLLAEKTEELQELEASLTKTNTNTNTDSGNETARPIEPVHETIPNDEEKLTQQATSNPDEQPAMSKHGEDKSETIQGQTTQLQPSSSSSSSVAAVPPSPSTKLDYQVMPLQRLKQLEKARDASLGWILKQIDAIEVKIKEVERRIKSSKTESV